MTAPPRSPSSPAPAPRRVLPVLVLAQLAGTSPWFAVNAVMPDLQKAQGWSLAELASLSAAVQMGFIAGTLLFAILALADRFPARQVFFWCGLASAACALVAIGLTSHPGALWWARAANGFFLAGIYPVGMKLAAQWFPQGLGAALGWLIGALVVGSASAHALRALGAAWPWQAVFVGVAVASVAAAVAVRLGLPQPQRRTAALPARPWRVLPVIVRDARLRASVFGYFGHMWELYAMWVMAPLVMAQRLQGAALSAMAFAVLGVGSIGCVAGGYAARRWGSARVAAFQLAASGLCCLLAPWMLVAPDAAFYGWLLLWGVTVAGDSPQFSALTASNAPPASMGSVLTLTNSLGFAISALSIHLLVPASQTLGFAGVLPWLAIGPALGLCALWPLWRPGPAGAPRPSPR